MRCGKLRDRIEIFRRQTISDDLGGWEEKDVFLGFRWADVWAPSTKDDLVAMQGAEIRSRVVMVRNKPGGDQAPKRGDLILWNGERLRVVTCRPDPKTGALLLDCVEDKP